MILHFKCCGSFVAGSYIHHLIISRVLMSGFQLTIYAPINTAPTTEVRIGDYFPKVDDKFPSSK